MIFDRDAKYRLEASATVRDVGVESLRTSRRSLWQHGVAQRRVGSCGRELLNPVIPADQRHLHRLLTEYVRCSRGVGGDMSKWKTENHFVSWLKLCPDNKISGGKVIGKARMPANNRATTALRMVATSLRESDSYLGAQFRRFRSRLGPPAATKAMAAKLARLFYRILRYGMKYVDQGSEFYEPQHPKQQIIHLKRKAAQLGLQITEAAAAA